MTATPTPTHELHALEVGTLYAFREWPNAAVPAVCAGVYSVWRGPALVYVGMSGRALSTDAIAAQRSAGLRGKGLFSRLNSHASGRRSGDQFCVYVGDRLVLPTLTPAELRQIGEGQLSFDRRIRDFIHRELAYRFVEVPDGAHAGAVERWARSGGLRAGKPLLNPL